MTIFQQNKAFQSSALKATVHCMYDARHSRAAEPRTYSCLLTKEIGTVTLGA